MNKLMILTIILYFTIFGCKSSKTSISYCDTNFLKKSEKIYLEDEGINATIIQVFDKKSKRQVFGYYLEGFRNDTNFIHSKIEYKGDTIFRKTYRDYKVTYGLDSVISIYKCQNGFIKTLTHITYWNGKIISENKE